MKVKMINSIIRRAAIGAAAIAAALAAGCASVAVSGDAIEQNTARALGLAPGSFTVSNRVDSGIKTTYNVKTTAGRQYGCYVTGTVAIVGRVVSDAMCTEMARQPGRMAGQAAPAMAPAQAPAPAPQQCNAFLKAAGRC